MPNLQRHAEPDPAWIRPKAVRTPRLQLLVLQLNQDPQVSSVRADEGGGKTQKGEALKAEIARFKGSAKWMVWVLLVSWFSLEWLRCVCGGPGAVRR